MINFFRKFRRLTASGSKNMKGTKYLKYAIGEIVLVVIGILIALTINQANERYKQRQKEELYLKSLYSELINDSIFFENADLELVRTEASARRVAKVLEDPKRKISDSLAFITDFRSMISRDQVLPQPVVWQELLNTGNLEIIQDRQLIEVLYQHYHRVNGCQADYNNNSLHFILRGRYFDSKVFSVRDQDDLFDNYRMDELPADEVFEKILESEEFDHVTHGIVTGMIISRLSLRGVKKSISKPLEMIRKKLN